MPALSRSRPSTIGARPAATSRCDPSRRSPPSRITTGPAEPRSTRAIFVWLRRSTPSLFRRATTMAASSGSSLARKSATSSTVTRDPSRRWACAISRPIGPPPITIRWLGQGAVGEDRLIGEIARLGKPGNRRCRRPRPGRQNDAPAPDAMRPGLQFGAADEARLLLQDAHAELLEALDRIVGRDGGDHLGHVIHDAAEIDLGLDRRDAEGGAVALRLRGLGGGNQRLGRHAAIVEAIATHLGALDQHDAEAELGGAGGHDQTRRAGADDADIRGQDGVHLTTTPCRRADARRAPAPAPMQQGRAAAAGCAIRR